MLSERNNFSAISLFDKPEDMCFRTSYSRFVISSSFTFSKSISGVAIDYFFWVFLLMNNPMTKKTMATTAMIYSICVSPVIKVYLPN